MGNALVRECCAKKEENDINIKEISSNSKIDILLPAKLIEKKENETISLSSNSKDKEQKINKNKEEHLIEEKISLKSISLTVFDKYEQLNRIGDGYFGTVYKAKEKETGKLYAIKEILKESLYNGKKSNKIKKKLENLKKINYNNLIKINDFYEDKVNIYIITELCDSGDLTEKVKDDSFFCEFLVKYIMYQVFLSVDFLHKNKIAHGDIKRGNIGIVSKKNNEKFLSIKDLIFQITNNEGMQKELLTVKNICDLNDNTKFFLKNLLNYEFKLMDYGVFDLFKQKENDELLCLTGTLNYMSPETFIGNRSLQSDEWSCGILMYNLLTGNYPFEGDSKENLINEIKNRKFDLSADILKQKTKSCKDLIFKLLNKDYKTRIKVDEVLNHEFFTKGIKINELLDFTNYELINVDGNINNYILEQKQNVEKLKEKNKNNENIKHINLKNEKEIKKEKIEKKEEIIKKDVQKIEEKDEEKENKNEVMKKETKEEIKNEKTNKTEIINEKINEEPKEIETKTEIINEEVKKENKNVETNKKENINEEIKKQTKNEKSKKEQVKEEIKTEEIQKEMQKIEETKKEEEIKEKIQKKEKKIEGMSKEESKIKVKKEPEKIIEIIEPEKPIPAQPRYIRKRIQSAVLNKKTETKSKIIKKEEPKIEEIKIEKPKKEESKSVETEKRGFAYYKRRNRMLAMQEKENKEKSKNEGE